jgi:hypothetical protein
MILFISRKLPSIESDVTCPAGDEDPPVTVNAIRRINDIRGMADQDQG